MVYTDKFQFGTVEKIQVQNVEQRIYLVYVTRCYLLSTRNLRPGLGSEYEQSMYINWSDYKSKNRYFTTYIVLEDPNSTSNIHSIMNFI